MKIVIINGMPQSGKSTFVQFCLTILRHNGIEISTVDLVKDMALIAGWDGEKTSKNRKFLSDLKDLLTEWNDVPMRKVKNKIRKYLDMFDIYDVDSKNVVIFIHCREPKEIQRFKDELGAKTLLIRREVVENNEQSNHADSEVFNFEYDYIIYNNGILAELEEKADDFLDLIIRKEDWQSKYPEEEK